MKGCHGSDCSSQQLTFSSSNPFLLSDFPPSDSPNALVSIINAFARLARATRAARLSLLACWHSPVLDVRRIGLGTAFESELRSLDDAAILAESRADFQRHFRRVANLKAEMRAFDRARRTRDARDVTRADVQTFMIIGRA